MTFKRTLSGRSNLPAFLGVNFVIYTEGGEFDKEKNKAATQSMQYSGKASFHDFYQNLVTKLGL